MRRRSKAKIDAADGHNGLVPRWLRMLGWISALVALALIAGSVAAVLIAHRSRPQTEGTVTLPGLSSPVTVIRDAAGIPQVYADTSADLFYAQGYVQSQDRFFEMDFRRHVTAGRLTLPWVFSRDAVESAAEQVLTLRPPG